MSEQHFINRQTGEVIEDPQIRPFADFLREQARGQTHDELSEWFWKVIQAVRDTGKKGSVSLTINVEPMKGDDQVMLITDKIDKKLPEHARTPSIYYTDDNGNPVRENPDQPKFEFLRDVSTAEPNPDNLKDAK